MESVIEFDSSSPAQETPEAKNHSKTVDFAQIFQAQAHDLLVAETAFARCAKFHLKQALGEAKYSMDVAPAYLHTLSLSVALRPDYVSITNVHTHPFTNEVVRLRRLIDGMAAAILSSKPQEGDPQYEGGVLYLVGALTTSISAVGNGVYNFVLKQKWSY